jgi:uncharacterized protein (DUF2164 family)
MRIRLAAERRAQLVFEVRGFVRDELQRELSDFQAERLVDFFVKHLGAPVYNQAIQDARGFLQEKLTDLEGELYEPEEPEATR